MMIANNVDAYIVIILSCFVYIISSCVCFHATNCDCTVVRHVNRCAVEHISIASRSAMVKPRRKADWLIDTTWCHVVSTNQSALRIGFTVATKGITQNCPISRNSHHSLGKRHCNQTSFQRLSSQAEVHTQKNIPNIIEACGSIKVRNTTQYANFLCGIPSHAAKKIR